MRILLLFRGAPGCGKSTYIEKHGLKTYTLSADDIRLLCQSPVLDVNGKECISGSNDRIVWDMLFKILETRMIHGEFTVIDATNSKTAEMNRYKELAKKYKYRIYIIDMTGVSIDECKRRNARRSALKRVPDEAIDKMYSRFANQAIPSGIKVLKPDQLNEIWYKPTDFSSYKNIHIIGDVHGCHTVLKEYMSQNPVESSDNMYIFLGDYIDRGIENADTLKLLYEISGRNNVYLCEGNHERWLWDYGNDVRAKSKEFEFVTKPQLISRGFTEKMAREFYRKLCQCCYFTYHGKEFLVTHGGLSDLPYNLTFVGTEQMIKGVGKYEESDYVDEQFTRNTNPNQYQIHGHRNVTGADIKTSERTFNLEDGVEFGGNLRCLCVSYSNNDGEEKISFKMTKLKNDIFKKPEDNEQVIEPSDISVYDLVQKMRNSEYINEKSFGRISSFNFNRDAFYKRKWNETVNKARGLYIDVQDYKIVARAYDKFFNIEERCETHISNLQKNLKFPVSAYVKENGFLGIVSWDSENDDLLITTKSDLSGDYAGYLRNMIYNVCSEETLFKMKKYIKENNVSFIFECCDMENEPHVIEYSSSKLVLLDVICNSIEFKKLPYNSLFLLAENFGLNVKTFVDEIKDWESFIEWYKRVTADDYKYFDHYIEGFVVEDQDGFMFKIKSAYYKKWKHLRSVANSTIKSGYFKYTGSLLTPLQNDFYGWCKTQFALPANQKEKLPKDICSLRKMFFADMGEKYEKENGV